MPNITLTDTDIDVIVSALDESSENLYSNARNIVPSELRRSLRKEAKVRDKLAAVLVKVERDHPIFVPLLGAAKIADGVASLKKKQKK